MTDFDSTRRQRFLSESYSKWLSKLIEEEVAHWSAHVPPNGGSEAGKRALGARYVARERFRHLLLKYTSGSDLNLLREELPTVIDALERYTEAKRVAEEDDTYPPYMFGEIEEYEAAMQLVALCHLLHRRDLLPRLAAMLDPSYRAQDTLYEDLLAYGMEGRVDVDKWFHEPYRDLINSFYSDTDELGISLVVSYLDKWYPAMRSASWHDSHLKADEKEGGAYVGYWAIEAAAATFLLQLDDSSYRDHLLYPKDLVDFARGFQSGQGAVGDGANRLSLRCEAGQPCPKAGYWLTPAKAGSRRYFKQGEVMPEVASDYGATIWQWDSDQSDPKL